MALRSPVPLTAAHDVAQFDCGVASRNDWLRRTAMKWQANRGTRVMAVTDEAGRVMGFYALSMGQVARAAAPKPLARNSPDPLPVLVMGRLAVARGLQGQGVARDLLLDAFDRTHDIGRTVGVVAMVVHALNEDAAAFYAKFGFRPAPQADEPLTLFKPMKDIAAEIAAAASGMMDR